MIKTIEIFLRPIMLEISFWSVLTACAIIVYLIIKESRAKELFLIIGILIVGFLLRMKFGFFAPMHEKIQYIEILNNYYYNHANHNFFGITSYYHSTFGFIDFFFNRILYFFDSFNVNYVYYTNIAVSLFKGIVLYCLAKIFFKNNNIAILSLLIFIFFPLEIRYSATEIQTQLTGFTILVYLALIALYYKKQKNLFLILALCTAFASLFGRIDFAFYFWVILFSTIILLYLNIKSRKKRAIIRLAFLLFVLAAFFANADLYLSHIGAGAGHNDVTYWSRVADYSAHTNIFPDIFFISSYFNNEHFGYSFMFLKYFFTPLYFFIFLKYSWLLIFCRSRKQYLILLFFTTASMLLIALLSRPMLKHIRLYLPIFPFLCLLVSCAIYETAGFIKNKKNIVLMIFALMIVVSIAQNKPFLNINMARKAEQDFIIEQIRKIPDRSLILTVTDKRFSALKFPISNECAYKDENRKYVEGREFPTYLLGNKNIDIMDICLEYNPAYFDNYDNIYYYRGLYAYYMHQNPRLTRDFEFNHELKEIAVKAVANHDLHSRDVDSFINGNTYMIPGTDGELNLGFYKLIL